MSRNFDSDNPKKNRLMRRKRPSYEGGVRDDGARLWRRKPVKSRSKYGPQAGADARAEEVRHETDPDGNPYTHNPALAEAHKMAIAEGDGPVSNRTANAYLRAFPPNTTIP